MTEITGDPDRVFDPLNPAELARMFQELKATVAPTITWLRRLDHLHHHATAAIVVVNCRIALMAGILQLRFRALTGCLAVERSIYRSDLCRKAPQLMLIRLFHSPPGLWRVGVEPPRIGFL